MRHTIAATLVPALLLAAAPALAAPDRIAVAATLRDKALDTGAYALLEDLTTTVGQRLAATPAEQRGRDWAVKAMKAAGLVNIKVEPFPMPVWERGIETAEVVGSHPQKLTIAALGYSGATPAAGITAPVAYFADYAALEAAAPGSLAGKIAFIDHHMMRAQDGSSYGTNGAVRRTGPALAASKGAVATLIRSLGTDDHRNPHTGGTVWQDRKALTAAAALSVPDAEQLARLVARGPVTLKLVITPTFNPDGQSANVSGEIPGSGARREVIVIGGHLDSWDLATGTIDDGAGMAITLSAARAIKDAGLKPRRTIRVVFWGAEEAGIWGGRAYAEAHKAENIVLAAESDFGADRVWRVSSKVAETGLPLIAEINRALAPLGVAPTRENGAGGGADVAPLGALGAGILELEQDGTRYFDLHHTPDDTFDKVEKAQLDQNVAAWAAAIWLAASDDRPLRTKAN
ncbi:M20/M25/M40 family metallo-hydrolase [Sandarakinorhabdus sp. DWP1-3-1]|uniref:M20/M25/M40 family metallo-hydrolase n=1 Tax=Sandarakinorhabdus sp. DWP1-3-1 TaxID=2804627 RepID=UPI003CEEF40D